MTNSAPNPRNTEVLGHLFGWPIREALFCRATSFTDYLQSEPSDIDSRLLTSQGHVSNTFSIGSAFHSITTPIVSAPVVGTKRGRIWANRVELRLLEAERKADTVELREEYQLARRILHRVFNDNCTNAYFLAFCWMYGDSPENVARKQEHYRQFMTRGSVLKLDSAALPPKKRPVSITVKSEVADAGSR